MLFGGTQQKAISLTSSFLRHLTYGMFADARSKHKKQKTELLSMSSLPRLLLRECLLI